MEDVEDEDMRSVENIAPTNLENILELSDHGAEAPKVPKKSQKGGGKKLKPRHTLIIDSSDESDDGAEAPKVSKKSQNGGGKKLKPRPTENNADTELEEDENKKETPEEEVGKLLNITTK